MRRSWWRWSSDSSRLVVVVVETAGLLLLRALLAMLLEGLSLPQEAKLVAWLALGALEEHVLAWKALEAMREHGDALGLDHHRLLSASLTSLNNSLLSVFGLSHEAELLG